MRHPIFSPPSSNSSVPLQCMRLNPDCTRFTVTSVEHVIELVLGLRTLGCSLRHGAILTDLSILPFAAYIRRPLLSGDPLLHSLSSTASSTSAWSIPFSFGPPVRTVIMEICARARARTRGFVHVRFRAGRICRWVEGVFPGGDFESLVKLDMTENHRARRRRRVV